MAKLRKRKVNSVGDILAGMKGRDNEFRKSREQRLRFGFGKAVTHLSDEEMSAIEAVVYKTLGRAALFTRFP